MSVGTEHLIVEKDGPVVTVTMNRPERRNALSPEMLVGMYDAWQMIDEDADVRVAILTGGGGTFCSGADLKAMAEDNQGSDRERIQRRFAEDPELHWKALLRHHRLTKPLIAAVEGFAVAGGTEILQATDIRIAAETATFGVTEVTRGLFPLGGSTVRLRRQIPYTLAAEILLTGRHVSAQEAKAIGLIGRVVPHGEALAEARTVAAQVAENGPLAVQAVLRSLRETEGLSEQAGLARELEIGAPIFGTEDAREGPRAFAEKRKPKFTGR
ncbi:MAG: crotonase/enoyl-CoA hydratase family protein [Deltaproteobacteria bacterium]|nr:MAG: crotonase/enoyl-CoA hydratase family protein [Deltaproteobacteria bacterium]